MFSDDLKVSPGLQQLLEKMMAESVRDRYQSVKEVFAALKKLDSAPVKSPPPVASSPPPEAVKKSTETTKPISPSQATVSSAPPASKPSAVTAETMEVLGEAVAKVPSTIPNSPLKSMSTPDPWASKALSGGTHQTTSSVPNKQTYPWWNRPLIGNYSLTQRLVLLFFKPSISERSLQIHQKSLSAITKLSQKALTVDNEKFGNDEFLAFVRIRYAFMHGGEEYAHLMQSAALLEVGVKTKNSFNKIEQIELAYRSPKQTAFYEYTQDLLTQKLEKRDICFPSQSSSQKL